jgi:LmbE family N-acetylglucosaminyl deacetylase
VTQPKKILVILAHPDDPEFFCGATLAKWAKDGHQIVYHLLTCGEKGSNNPNTKKNDLCLLRQKEQRDAAKIIGVTEVHFSKHPDGELAPDMDTRREVTHIIRQHKPDTLLTFDPTNLYPTDFYPLNHPDHRAAGQVVLDALFPGAGNPHYYPEQLSEKIQPHMPKEVWLCLPKEADTRLDITETWQTKIAAILAHKSQTSSEDPILKALTRFAEMPNTTKNAPRYEEPFRVLHLMH